MSTQTKTQQAVPLYKSFPAAFHPAADTVEALENAGFVDRSWINDTCPTWCLYAAGDTEQETAIAQIWVEPDEEGLRTEGVTHKYTAFFLEGDGLTPTEKTIDTDDLEAAIAFIIGEDAEAALPPLQHGETWLENEGEPGLDATIVRLANGDILNVEIVRDALDWTRDDQPSDITHYATAANPAAYERLIAAANGY